MSEVEKQDSQKTVVAFVSGLLIGGLLVWIFSSSPEKVDAPEIINDDSTEEVASDEANNSEEREVTNTTRPVVVGEGSIIIPDQEAGTVVTIGSMSLPVSDGWVVVREFTNGVVGNILGAARFSLEEELVPERIQLIRGTTAGGLYQVVFFTNEGDISFNLGEDVLIEGIATTFEAN